MRDAGQVGCRTGGKQDRWDAGLVGYRTGGKQAMLRSRNYLFLARAQLFSLILAPAPAIYCHLKMYSVYM